MWLKEAITVSKKQDPTWQDTVADLKAKDPNAEISITEEELDEAELTNHMNDYRGGVVYVLTDPSQADVVAQNIKRWTAKKGFTAIKHKKSADGSKGYFYFRLGPDPGTEAQKIQGYFAQLPLLKHFKFKVLGEKPVQKKPRPNI